MSIPNSGTYRLRNVKYPNQMFDLRGGSANDGTPIVGYTNNNNSQNMLWTMQVVDPSKKLVRLINVASGTFAQIAGSNTDTGVVGSHNARLCRVVQRHNLGEYALETTDGGLACCLSNNKDYTQVRLEKVDGNDSIQGWIFCPE